MTVVSRDKNGNAVPIIVGRAKTLGAERKNICDAVLNAEHPWTIRFPRYVVIYDIAIVNASIGESIILLDLIQDIDSNLYPNMIGADVAV